MFDDYFGLCPICHKTDGYANVGKSHIFYCKEHKKSWFVGINIFSSWREQTEDEQRRTWNEIGLEDFEEVKPYFYPRRIRAVIAAVRAVVRAVTRAAEEPCPF